MCNLGSGYSPPSPTPNSLDVLVAPHTPSCVCVCVCCEFVDKSKTDLYKVRAGLTGISLVVAASGVVS